jgi:hypothetical protein
MRASLSHTGRLGGVGALRDPGSGRLGAALAGFVLLLLGALALVVIPPIADRAEAQNDLTRLVLVGARNLTCQRVVVLLDQSGSMTEYAQVRDDAMATLAAWAPENLRADDQLAVVRWADTATIDVPPTEVGSLTPSSLAVGTGDVGGGTSLDPSIEQVASMGETSCRTSLVYVSDGQIAETSAARLEPAIRASGIDRIGLILPNSTSAPEYWLGLFPYSDVFHADPDDPRQTARALGEAMATATGQQLEVAP